MITIYYFFIQGENVITEEIRGVKINLTYILMVSHILQSTLLQNRFDSSPPLYPPPNQNQCLLVLHFLRIPRGFHLRKVTRIPVWFRCSACGTDFIRVVDKFRSHPLPPVVTQIFCGIIVVTHLQRPIQLHKVLPKLHMRNPRGIKSGYFVCWDYSCK